MKRERVALAYVLALVGGVACSTTVPGDAADAGDPDGETTEDRDVRELVMGGVLDLLLLGRLTSAAFHFYPPTLDNKVSAAENAGKISETITTALAGCGSVSSTANMDAGTLDALTVSFGGGCTLPDSDLTVSGTMTLAVQKGATTMAVAVTLTGIVANGVPLDGKATFTTPLGDAFNVDVDLASGARTVTANEIVFGGDRVPFSTTGKLGFIINRAASFSLGSLHLPGVSVSSVQYTSRDCYPNGGIMTVVREHATYTYSLSDTTPSTGMVSVTKSPVAGNLSMYMRKLPAYGRCGGT